MRARLLGEVVFLPDIRIENNTPPFEGLSHGKQLHFGLWFILYTTIKLKVKLVLQGNTKIL